MRLRSSIVIPGSTKKWFSPDRAKTRLMRRLRCRSRAYRRLAGRCPALGCRHRPCAVCRGFLPFCFLCAISTLAGLPACTSTRHESTAAGSAEGSPGEGDLLQTAYPRKNLAESASFGQHPGPGMAPECRASRSGKLLYHSVTPMARKPVLRICSQPCPPVPDFFLHGH